MLLHPLLAAPFFVLAWLSGRWPRVAGILLLAVAVGLFVLLGGFRSIGFEGVTFIFFIGPLLASGVALLGAGKSDRTEE